MSTPNGFKDLADQSFLTLVGELPELVRNLVVAEIESAKKWLKRVSKDAGFGAIWVFIALFFLFWAIAVLVAFAVIGFASWMPLWGSALLVFGILIVAVAVFLLLGVVSFRKIAKTQNPVQSVATDVKEIRDEL